MIGEKGSDLWKQSTHEIYSEVLSFDGQNYTFSVPLDSNSSSHYTKIMVFPPPGTLLDTKQLYLAKFYFIFLHDTLLRLDNSLK